MYQIIKDKFNILIKGKEILDQHIQVKAKPLTSEEAIGNPECNDYPIQKGKEFMMQADFRGAKGQAFTDMYGDFEGSLAEVLSMELNNNFRRAVFISTVNAVMKHMGLVDKTIHCKDSQPATCAKKLVEYVKKNYNITRVALVGLQPRMLEQLDQEYIVRVNDMDPDFIGKEKFGITIDPPEKMEENLNWCDLVISTGTTLVNNSIQKVLKDKPVLFFGVTISGASQLLGLKCFCSEAS